LGESSQGRNTVTRQSPHAATFGARLRAGILAVAVALAAGCGKDSPEKLVSSARDLIAKGDNKSAEIHLKNALQQQPELGEARYLLGLTLMTAGDYASAEKEFRRALEFKYPPGAVYPRLARAVAAQDPKKLISEFAGVRLDDAAARAAVNTELGNAHLALAQVKEARAAFAAALADKPGDPTARIGEARIIAVDGNLDGAMKIVDEVLAQSPGMPEALMLKADIHISRKEVDPAIAAMREVVQAQPLNAAARFTLAMMLLDARKFGEAAAEIEAMKKALPQDVRARYLEALLAFQQHEPAKAREPLQLVLKIAPDHGPSLVLAGAIEYQLGQFVAAEDYLRKAVGRMPQNTYARSVLAATYLRLGKPDKAEEVIEPGLRQAPNDPQILRVAGEVALSHNDPKRAMAYYERAAAVSKSDAAVRARLGAVKLATGDTEGALKDLETASEMDAGAVQADLAIIAAHLSKREFDKALAVSDRIMQKQPKSPLPHTIRGGILVAKGDRKGARASFEKSLELQPDYLPAVRNLARMDIVDKQPAAARKRFESIVAKDPKNDLALLGLADAMAATGAKAPEVLAVVDRAVAANPTSVRARLAAINLRLQTKDPKGALAAAQSAAAALPENVQVVEALGRAQLAAGESQQAVSTYNKLAALMPQSPAPLILLGRAQAAAKDYDAAAQTLRKALAMQPSQMNALQQLMAVQIAAGKPEEALAEARALQKERPKDPAGWVLEGEVHIAQNKMIEAIGAYSEALKRQSAPAIAIRLHALLSGANRAADADALAARWLKEHPKDAAMRLYLAERDLRRKDYRAASGRYRELLALQPENALVLNNLAWALEKQNDPGALGYAEKAYALAPNNAAIADTLGWMLVERGETKRGVELLAKASGAAPNALEIRMHYAKALIKAGDKPGARKELEAVAAAPGESPFKAEAAELLKKL
jgi:putative PEP-CTERM system TPR-repeat lipoprotein